MGTPGIPPPASGSPATDLKNATPAAKSMAALVHELMKDMGATDADANAAAQRGAVAILHTEGIFGHIVAAIIELAAPFVLSIVDIIGKTRTDMTAILMPFAEAALSEFLAADIKISEAPGATPRDKTIAAVHSIGQALYARLLTEFVPDGVVTPASGEEAAKRFTGYAVNFGVQNAILATLADALSIHELQEMRELGEEVAKNLGLGRLQRMALGTLMDNVIRKPYTLALQARYRPNRLSVPEYIHSHNRGEITDDQLHTALGQLGFPDGEIAAVINEYTDKLSLSELVTLVRYGKLTEDTAVKMLQAQGLDASTAAMRFQAAELAILNDNVKAYADALSQKYRNKTMDEDTYDKLFAQVPWADDEKMWTKRADGVYREYYEHMLTWTQVITAFEQGIVDVDYVEAWLTSKAYSPEDIVNMELLLAVKFDAFAAAAAKKGATPKPPPTPKPAPGP